MNLKSEVQKEAFVVVQFYPCFNFNFLLFQTHYDTSPYPKTKENENETKDKIEPQHIFICVTTAAKVSLHKFTAYTVPEKFTHLK